MGSIEAEIQLENPLNPNESIGAVKLKNQALGASSNLKRMWHSVDNAKYSHIQNPDGKNLMNNLLMTATISDNALRADVLATSLFLDPSMANIDGIKSWGEYCFVLKDLKLYRTAKFNLA